MYNNLIYLLLVLLILTTARGGEQVLPAWAGASLILIIYALFAVLARARIGSLLTRMKEGGSVPVLAYSRILTRLSMIALIFFAVDAYLLGLPDLLAALPVIGKSSALTGLVGLLCFALFLVILWGEAYYVYTVIFNSRLSRRRFVWGQLRFNLPIALPWLIITGVVDLAGLLPWTGLREWFESPAGELILVLTFMAVLVVLFPVLIRRLWGLTPLPPGEKREAIEKFCRENGFTYREIMLWPLYEGEAMTAGVMGIFRPWRYILITNSLLRVLDEEELDAVLGHEMGHVKGRHLYFYFLFFLGYMVLAYTILDPYFFLPLLPDSALDLILAAMGNPSPGLSLAISAPFILMMIVYFRFVLGVFLRNFERQADLFSYQTTGTIKGLVGSLEKIAYYSGQSRKLPSWHHYSVAERVEFLNACEQDPSLVPRHHQRVRRLLVAYLVIITAAGLTGYQLKNSPWSQNASQRLIVRALENEVEKYPANVEAQFLLGNVYFEAGRLAEAEVHYEKSLALEPDNPEIMNNLAWLLATKPGAGPKEKDRALTLAMRAAALKQEAHILDTLAEALFVNGLFNQAAQVINQAIPLIRPWDDREYFRKQKERFEAAARQSSGLGRGYINSGLVTQFMS